MDFFDNLAALAVPLIWILIMAGRFMKNQKKKKAYYAAEEKEAAKRPPENEPIHPKGTNW
jgi:hypothetical protein